MHIFEDPTAPTRHIRKLFPAVRVIPQQVLIQQVEYHRRPHSSSNRVHESTWDEKKYVYEDRKKRKRNVFLEAHVSVYIRDIWDEFSLWGKQQCCEGYLHV